MAHWLGPLSASDRGEVTLWRCVAGARLTLGLRRSLSAAPKSAEMLGPIGWRDFFGRIVIELQRPKLRVRNHGAPALAGKLMREQVCNRLTKQ